ncbi:MAG: hypothetical protein LBV47_05285 [Bacteroidales bacterium]|jgi:hypothetical protein|nr:hypothetical protein [Bacteroidales bacterium]
MENKKLIDIMLKDMGELEELISQIKTGKEFNPLEIEFLHTRSKGILQLMQMLNNIEHGIKTPLEIKEEKIEAEPPVTVGTNYEITEKEELNIPAGEKEPEIPNKETVNAGEIKIDASRRLGDSFTKGKSLNDVLEDCNKLEFKLSNRPVNNIQVAIGINDRFQYIRELFGGSSEKYTNTVILLDSMNSINDALSYLQQNFKWENSETGLKFINLVKRRFANE